METAIHSASNKKTLLNDNHNYKETWFTLKSAKSNSYLIAPAIPQIMLTHPILNYLLELVEKGVQIHNWLEEISDTGIVLPNGKKVPKEELVYYYTYYKLLEDSGYFGKRKKHPMSGNNYTADRVRDSLANCEHITFEVTNRCSLACKYCCFGDFYQGFPERNNRDLSFQTAKKLLDYYLMLRKFNRKQFKKVYIGFYGGEPLLNFPFIQQMVDYVESKPWTDTEVVFNITTNGVILSKHMDFLFEKNFKVLISLDGDMHHNDFRVFPDGNSSFAVIMKNISKLREFYPNFFETNVDFNAIIHKKNSQDEVEAFFKEEFAKIPLIADLSTAGLNPDKSKEFNEAFCKKRNDTSPPVSASTKRKNSSFTTSEIMAGRTFLMKHTSYILRSYRNLIEPSLSPTVVRTATCEPFSKKIFLTVDGKILPCERIPQKYSLGEVDDNSVKIEFQQIANTYNQWFQKLSTMCNRCRQGNSCRKCIFYLELDNLSCECDQFTTMEGYKKHSEKILSLIEQNPLLYSEVLRD